MLIYPRCPKELSGNGFVSFRGAVESRSTFSSQGIGAPRQFFQVGRVWDRWLPDSSTDYNLPFPYYFRHPGVRVWGEAYFREHIFGICIMSRWIGKNGMITLPPNNTFRGRRKTAPHALQDNVSEEAHFMLIMICLFSIFISPFFLRQHHRAQSSSLRGVGAINVMSLFLIAVIVFLFVFDLSARICIRFAFYLPLHPVCL